MAESLERLSILHYRLGTYEEARRASEQGLAIRERLFGADSTEVAASMDVLAAVIGSGLGDNIRAEALARKVVQTYCGKLGRHNPRCSDAMNQLAITLQDQGRLEEAVPLYREVIAIERKALGPDHPDLAIDMENLSGVLSRQGKYDESLAMLREVLAIRRAKLGDDSRPVTRTLYHLAEGERVAGRLEAARASYAEAVARFRAAYGDDHPARFGERVPAYLGRLARSADVVAEVRQTIAVRCLVGDGDRPPALAGYSGKGSLEGWVRATAVREALALAKRDNRNAGSAEEALEARMPWADREISLFKQIYREPVSRAFRAACAGLPAAQRALLRLHYVQGVTTANLARMYAASRATIVRRLTEAREALVDAVKGELRATAGIEAQDFESILRLVKSQLDLRLSVILKDPDTIS